MDGMLREQITVLESHEGNILERRNSCCLFFRRIKPCLDSQSCRYRSGMLTDKRTRNGTALPVVEYLGDAAGRHLRQRYLDTGNGERPDLYPCK